MPRLSISIELKSAILFQLNFFKNIVERFVVPISEICVDGFLTSTIKREIGFIKFDFFKLFFGFQILTKNNKNISKFMLSFAKKLKVLYNN
ncbi:hypothetical protein BpHYR1_006495 [Brachionus plicatilis]|uniref:Uncharacterized protein n=1 Tax=Brachionus plicatilis TaxID=10195 RepID=A0A3M7PWU7_BRAPC|nr:hypothetical protein BpHYR1_006495 [Brachionus plicatilis]